MGKENLPGFFGGKELNSELRLESDRFLDLTDVFESHWRAVQKESKVDYLHFVNGSPHARKELKNRFRGLYKGLWVPSGGASGGSSAALNLAIGLSLSGVCSALGLTYLLATVASGRLPSQFA